MITADFLSKLLHQPELLQDVSNDDLEQLTKQYPWFGAGQLLLAAKLKQQEHPSAHEQTQKAALYFPDVLLFTNELNRFSNQTKEPVSLPTAAGLLTEEDQLLDETDAAMDAEALIEAKELEEEMISPVSDAVLDAETIVEVETLKEEQEAVINDSVIDAETLIDAELDKEVLEASVTDAVLNAETIVEAETLKEEQEAVINDAVTDAETLIEAEQHKEQPATGTLQPETGNQQPATGNLQPETGNIQPETGNQQPETQLIFEPYHTVDYFASQGIKLQEDKLGNDRLGQQVKSFTQWLKSMKKIYVEEKKELNATEEKEVINKATESNQPKEIITETMADVLLKQGKKAQAIELYEKLSLLHPEKSAYFAALIKDLKS